MPHLAAAYRIGAARILAERGRLEEARREQRAGEAVSVARHVGMRGLITRAEALAAAAGNREASPT